ncbi:MAG: hypothetical protein ACO24H_05105 [Polynucleobacter sp.]|jgi:predicted RNase H-like nuclease (RuvC/YqgF family)
MIDFIQKQLEASDRLLRSMETDHKERMEIVTLWAEMNTNLLRKLAERDKLIEELRANLASLGK